MKHLCDPNKSTAKGKHTNRLKFIAIEDVSPKCIEDFNPFYLILKDWEGDYFNIISLTQPVYILFSSKKNSAFVPTCVSDSHVPEKVDWRELFNTQNMKPSEEYQSEVARAIERHYRYAFIDSGNLNKIVTLRKKKVEFNSFWDRLREVCWSSRNMKKNLTFKREMFEPIAHFKEEVICLISAAESAIAYVNCNAPNEADRFPRSADGSCKASEGFPTPVTSPLRPPKPARTEVRQYSWRNSTRKEVCMHIRTLKPFKSRMEKEELKFKSQGQRTVEITVTSWIVAS